MSYVDGYVLAVKKNKLGQYQKMAKDAGKVWMKYGALQYFECAGDDVNPKWATLKFPSMAKTKPGETVMFSFVVYKSKAHRDAVNKKVHKDLMKNNDKWTKENVPFDMKRMAYGGFKAIVEY